MSTRRAVIFLVLASIVGLTIAPLASGAVVGVLATEESTEDTETNTTVSTFMQASTADAENAVEAGMFESAYENADNDSRAGLVANRTDDLETTLASLEAEREELREQKEAGNISHGEYQARMAKLTVDINALDRAIEQTKPRAVDAGVDESRLETLQQNASELAGPEVAAIAQGMPGHERVPGQGPPDDRDAGPPMETGQPGDDKGMENNSTPRGGDGPPENAPSGPDDGNGQPDATPGSADGEDQSNSDSGPSADSGKKK